MNEATPTPTEAHRKLCRDVIFSATDGAELIADSEARAVAAAVSSLTCTHHNDKQRAACPVCFVATLTAERDRLRAEVAALVVTKDRACTAAADNKAEADQWHAELQTAEREVERLNGCCEELHTIIDNHGYPSGVDYAKMEARAERAEADAERYRFVTLRQDAELATERARLDWLAESWDNPLAINLHPSYGWSEASKNLRAAIDAAMKEDAK